MPVVAPSAGELNSAVVGNLVPVHVLDEDIVVRLWTVENGIGQPMLAYLAEELADFDWIVLSPTSPAVVQGLEDGSVALRDAVVGTWMWLVRRGHDGSVHAWSVTEGFLCPGKLPKPGVRLRLEHMPAIATRAVGPLIGRATTPASVVAWVADSTRKAVKVLVDYMLELGTGGRPTDEARSLYDLPIRTLAFHSFEIGFGIPDSAAGRDSVQQAIEMLQTGFDWLACDGDEPLLPNTSAEERVAVLAALKVLAPPKHGPITQVEVGGLWMRRGGTLNRQSRAKLQREIDAVHAETAVTYVGRVRELDRDRGTFILRDLPDRPEVRGVISLETWDEFIDYFATEERVAVIGILRGGRFYAQAIAPVPVDR